MAHAANNCLCRRALGCRYVMPSLKSPAPHETTTQRVATCDSGPSHRTRNSESVRQITRPTEERQMRTRALLLMAPLRDLEHLQCLSQPLLETNGSRKLMKISARVSVTSGLDTMVACHGFPLHSHRKKCGLPGHHDHSYKHPLGAR